MKPNNYYFHLDQARYDIEEARRWGPATHARCRRAYWQHQAAYHRQECMRILRGEV